MRYKEVEIADPLPLGVGVGHSHIQSQSGTVSMGQHDAVSRLFWIIFGRINFMDKVFFFSFETHE